MAAEYNVLYRQPDGQSIPKNDIPLAGPTLLSPDRETGPSQTSDERVKACIRRVTVQDTTGRVVDLGRPQTPSDAAFADRIPEKVRKELLSDGRDVCANGQSEEKSEENTKRILGRDVPVDNLFRFASEIEVAYRNAGYAFTHVIVPHQELAGDDATFTIRVIEGRIVNVRFATRSEQDGKSADAGGSGAAPVESGLFDGFRDCLAPWSAQPERSVANRQILAYLDTLKSIESITIRDIERAVLLAEGIPGVRVRPFLRPSEKAVGGIEMVVLTGIDHYEGHFVMDNRGPDFSGPVQAQAVGRLNACTGYGDQLEVAYFRAGPDEQRFIQGAFGAAIGTDGLRWQIYGGEGRTDPGNVLALLGYRGSIVTAGLRGHWPIVLRRDVRVSLEPEFQFSNAWIDVDNPNSAGSKVRQSESNTRVARVFGRVSFIEDVFGRDWEAFGGYRGEWHVQAGLHQGFRMLGATSPATTLTPRPEADGRFWKATFDIETIQKLATFSDGLPLGVGSPDRDRALLKLRLAMSGQYAHRLLLPSEKFGAGGRHRGRGYYAAQVTGDRGYSWTIEPQIERPVTLGASVFAGDLPMLAQAYAFYDRAVLFDLGVDDVPKRSIDSVGVGGRLVVDDRAELEGEIVRRLTLRPLGDEEDKLAPWGIYGRLVVRF